MRGGGRVWTRAWARAHARVCVWWWWRVWGWGGEGGGGGSSLGAMRAPAHPPAPHPTRTHPPTHPPCSARLFGALIRQPVAFFDEQDTPQLTSRLAGDCSVVSRLFSTSINVALRNALQARSLTLSFFVSFVLSLFLLSFLSAKPSFFPLLYFSLS